MTQGGAVRTAILRQTSGWLGQCQDTQRGKPGCMRAGLGNNLIPSHLCISVLPLPRTLQLWGFVKMEGGDV